MIQCLPRGLCSWDYELQGSGCSAILTFNWGSEQGSLIVDGQSFQIVKRGVFHPTWSLESANGTHFTARKPSSFTRDIEITGEAGLVLLKAASMFGREMNLQGPGFGCTISPEHAFTRRATITGDPADFRLAAFAFWLTAMQWRRAAGTQVAQNSA